MTRNMWSIRRNQRDFPNLDDLQPERYHFVQASEEVTPSTGSLCSAADKLLRGNASWLIGNTA
jgi:hypothetical protein